MVSAHEKAFALRPVRIDEKNNQILNYEGTTFPNGPRAGCDLYLRRLEAFGFLKSHERQDNLILDVLAENGDILQDFGLTQSGLKYLRSQLRFKREPRNEH